MENSETKEVKSAYVPPYRVGRSLGTTIYRRGEAQPCGWFPNNPALALIVVKMLNAAAESAPYQTESE